MTPAVFLQRMDTGGQDTFGLAEPEFESPTLIGEAARDESAITSLTVKYDFGWSDLTSVTGYFWRDDNRLIDGTSVRQRLHRRLAARRVRLRRRRHFRAGRAGAIRNQRQSDPPGDCASPPSRPAGRRWAWIAGLYYSRTRTGLLDNEHIPGFNSTFESTYNDTPARRAGRRLPGRPRLLRLHRIREHRKGGVRPGHLQHHPGTQSDRRCALREGQRRTVVHQRGYFPAATPPFYSSATGSKTTPKGVISYDVSESTMVYASAAEGFRIGGINRPVPCPCAAAISPAWGSPRRRTPTSRTACGATNSAPRARAAEHALGLGVGVRHSLEQHPDRHHPAHLHLRHQGQHRQRREPRRRTGSDPASPGSHVTLTLGGNYTSAKITVPVTLLGVEKGDPCPRRSRLLHRYCRTWSVLRRSSIRASCRLGSAGRRCSPACCELEDE
jgi:hypothetical protein